MTASQDWFGSDNFEQVLEAFKDCDISAIPDVPHEDFYSMSRALYDTAAVADQNGERALSSAMRILADVCSFVLSPEKISEPFGPLWTGGGRRAAIPDDFTGPAISFLGSVVDLIDNHSLKARVADLVWVTKRPRDVHYALTAIDYYTKVPLHGDKWTREQYKHWQRAIGLNPNPPKEGVGSAS